MCHLCHWDRVLCRGCAPTTKLLAGNGEKMGAYEVESRERQRSVHKKKCTIPSGGMRTHGHPWPRIRTWAARTQQPAGSLFVSTRKPGGMASSEYRLLTDIGAGAEMPQLLFCQGNKAQLHRSFVYLHLKGIMKDKWPCHKTKHHNSINTGEWHEKSTQYNHGFPPSQANLFTRAGGGQNFHCELLWAVLPNKCCLALMPGLCPWTGKIARVWPKL